MCCIVRSWPNFVLAAVVHVYVDICDYLCVGLHQQHSVQIGFNQGNKLGNSCNDIIEMVIKVQPYIRLFSTGKKIHHRFSCSVIVCRG